MYILLIFKVLNITLPAVYDCYVKYKTTPCIDFQNNFFETNIKPRCSSHFVLFKNRLEKYNPKKQRMLANIHKKGTKKEYIISKLLQLKQPIL